MPGGSRSEPVGRENIVQEFRSIECEWRERRTRRNVREENLMRFARSMRLEPALPFEQTDEMVALFAKGCRTRARLVIKVLISAQSEPTAAASV